MKRVVLVVALVGSVARTDDAPVERVVARIGARALRAERDTPWIVLHGLIAFERTCRVRVANESMDATRYLLTRAKWKGRRIFREQDGAPVLPPAGLVPRREVQDHVDQFLYAFADADVPLDAPLVVDTGKRFRIRDLVAAAQRGFREGQELGWTLPALAHYVGFDASWRTAAGRRYRVEDLLRLAIRRDATREVEGGTHHLYGVAFALSKYRLAKKEQKLVGVWAEAELYLRRYVQFARQFQQSDGAFSGNLMRGSSPPESPALLVWGTGHMIEWLTVACDARELRRPWIRRAVARLCAELERHPLDTFGAGGLYHAAHALRRWREATAR